MTTDEGMRVILVQTKALADTKVLAQEAMPYELGGILVGWWEDDNVAVVQALLPVPDQHAGRAHYERKHSLAQQTLDEHLRAGGGSSSGYIGEWHSHPPGHSASPSRDDLVQLVHLTLGMADDGLPAVQLIVGEQDLQILQGEVK